MCARFRLFYSFYFYAPIIDTMQYTDEDDTEANAYHSRPGSLTEHKQRTLGTQAAVSNAHRQYKINEGE